MASDARTGFARADLARALLARLDGLPRGFKFMEVCGTHTMALFETGLRSLLAERGIELVSGPGCPVCVTAQADLDYAFALAELPDTVLCTFGDMLRVPGTSTNLEQLRAEGARVKVVYSPLEATQVAAQEPDSRVVFLAIGFETTAPAIGLLAAKALQDKLSNLYILPLNKTVPPALALLAEHPQLKLDGLLLPGHVSVVTGARAYAEIPQRYGLPCAIAGFEPVDILRGVVSLVEQILTGEPCVENAYSRVVTEEGNIAAQAIINRTFTACDAPWRGLGSIPGSGLALSEEFAHLDARQLLPSCTAPVMAEPPGCRCGDVLCGLIQPTGCPLFGRSCSPETPVGACMVSQEGACRAYFRYHGAR